MLKEAVLTGHSDSKTPEPVEKPLCTKNHSSFRKACVTGVPEPGCAAGLPIAIAHTGVPRGPRKHSERFSSYLP